MPACYSLAHRFLGVPTFRTVRDYREGFLVVAPVRAQETYFVLSGIFLAPKPHIFNYPCFLAKIKL